MSGGGYIGVLPEVFPIALLLPPESVIKLTQKLMDVDGRHDTKTGSSFAVTTDTAATSGRWRLWLSQSSYRYLTDAVDIFE